jgi:Flp pilus assembly pilin Flp
MKKKKAQTIAEYAVLIGLVVTAVIAMRLYVVRALQARIHDASRKFATDTSTLGNTTQYEPYYLESSYDVTSQDKEREVYSVGGQVTRTTAQGDEETRRAATGYQLYKNETGAD